MPRPALAEGSAETLVLGLAVAAAGAQFGSDGHVAGWPVQCSLMACRGKRDATWGLAGTI